jgi:micrococcal nuclease
MSPAAQLLILLLALAAVLLRWRQERAAPHAPESLAEGEYQLDRVVDGDTLLLTNGARVRLIGVDTPETKKPDHPVEPWGPEATQFSQVFLAGGRLRLTFDRERVDRYGRFLAYAWVGERLLNEELIRAGLGRAVLTYPYSSSMKTRFRRAEEEARAKRRGIWSAGVREAA